MGVSSSDKTGYFHGMKKLGRILSVFSGDQIHSRMGIEGPEQELWFPAADPMFRVPR